MARKQQIQSQTTWQTNTEKYKKIIDTHKLYVLEDAPNPIKVDVGHLIVSLPKKPPRKDMINYGLPYTEQKFVYRDLPKDLHALTEDELEELAFINWHKRINGYWILIKGKEIYIPPGADTFFNYWKTEAGTRPTFRMEAVEFFQAFYLEVVNNPNVFGLLDIKCRRLGDTEKSIFCMWELGTRYRNSRIGMQHLKDDDAQKNFDRMVRAAMDMPYFFKPIHRGSDNPTNRLEYMKPKEITTSKTLRDKGDTIVEDTSTSSDFLNSIFDFEPGVTLAYDGQILHGYHLDEAFKQRSAKLDPEAQWSNIKRCTSLFNGSLIVGKSIITSTVESMEDGRMVEVARSMWEASQQAHKDSRGRTSTGLVAIFRDYLKAARVDEYGFPMIKEAMEARERDLKLARDSGNLKEILSIRRKQPETIDDALAHPEQNCILNPELCDLRLRQIKDGLNWLGQPEPNILVEGNLEWENGRIGSNVIFVPKEGGRWNMSLLPGKYANRVTRDHRGKLIPCNTSLFVMGCDPYDHETTDKKGSDGAFVVRAKFIPEMETKELVFDENGRVINNWDLMTDQFICDYVYRHKNPYAFYEDCIKTAIFYGCKVMPETDKPGFVVWAANNGFGKFIDNSIIKKNTKGMKATTEVINRYTDALVVHTYVRVQCTKLPRLVKNWRNFVKELRTRFDLTVASGFAEIACGGITNLADKEIKPSNAWDTTTFGL